MQAARVGLVPCIASLLLLAAAWPVAPVLATMVLYGATVVLHLAFPRFRSSDLSAAMAIWATLLVFLSEEPSTVAALRWLWALAAIGLAILPMKVSRMRARMSRAPFLPLGRTRRRGDPPQEAAEEEVLSPAPLLLTGPAAKS
ncbi:hypothetical protein DVW87_08490 [Sphingomonas aracearum]|uniref:Uncharacterized protein n=2 Tax=Sphingomonas aracearum TaxID=2283317 RepID=A0A369VUG8_9SPHN|nr:hypothetical protein DVW87_08490 [Sphingomonas aracearum]